MPAHLLRCALSMWRKKHELRSQFGSGSYFRRFFASWEIFAEAAPYLIFGFGIAGLLNSDRNSPLHLRYSFYPTCRKSCSQRDESGHSFCFPSCRSDNQCSNYNDGCPLSGKTFSSPYLGAIPLCVLSAGFLLDWFYLKLGISAAATVGTAKELLPEDMKLGFAFLLLPLMLYGAFRSEKECGCSERH